MANLKDVKYDAFISYRHTDPDGYVAKTLHKKLETFKIPRSVVKKLNLKSRRISRVFRDEEELPVDRKDMPAMMFSGLLVIGLPCFLIILLIVGVTILLFGR